ncbi:hypothetical protein GXN76_03625 [Kroppenstedtia pulmonis]|uniref:Uncharacterized protein n=1 Tax=Kroppenstedtia pulmonis TaxID=1380685 RepID=A0A7D4BEL1_9BACL|nr:hypothetical protein [Kroppenstedtia pulmonis]QKG83652.1 hypothetical protein GXN76_03625 [Kroppenstedtia pulmonis]
MQDKGAEERGRKVMLGSLFWSYLILGLGLLVWRFLGHQMIESLYVIQYIGTVLLITAVLMAIARKIN